jgi:hypothetical protein
MREVSKFQARKIYLLSNTQKIIIEDPQELFRRLKFKLKKSWNKKSQASVWKKLD